MGNLKSNKTKEEWDDLVIKVKDPTSNLKFVEHKSSKTEQFIQEAAEKYGLDIGNKDGTAQFDFIAGAEWMMENIKINFRRVK